MFAFNPKNDAEIQAIQNRHLLANGVYSFRVKEIIQKVSKSNNPMLEVKMGIVDSNGEERNLTDYLMATENMIFKFKHFCESLGLEKEYESGQLDPAKCIGRTGKCKIGLQKGNLKDDGSGYYPDKNSIQDYIIVQEVKVDPTLNDDIQF